MRRLYHLHFKFFSSLKLTLMILIGLSIALFVGMFWDQTKNIEEHLLSISNSNLGLVFRNIFLFLELHDVFHSWWFGILVLLLAINLIGCSIAKLPNIWIDARNPKKILDSNILKKSNIHKIIKLKILPKYFFNSKELKFSKNNIDYIFFEKHKYARCGVYVIHTALLFLMFGSIIATQAGVDGNMLIPEGRFERNVNAKGPRGSYYTHKLDFLIKCEDFRLKTYTDNSPMDYESDLAIYELNNLETPIISKTIRVNDPLEYKGYTFYQASYQAMGGEKLVNLRMGPHGQNLKAYQAKLFETLSIETADLAAPKIKIIETYEDYAGLGSAILIEQVHPQYGQTNFVVFRKHPNFDSQVRRGEIDVIFSGFDEPYATGISVGKVPGLNAVFFGFILMFIGLFIAFGMSLRRYYARIIKLESGEYEVTLAGIAHRYPQAFEKEFDKITEVL